MDANYCLLIVNELCLCVQWELLAQVSQVWLGGNLYAASMSAG